MENIPHSSIVCSDIIVCKFCKCSSDIRKEYQEEEGFIACVACGFISPIGFADGTAECQIDQSSNGLDSSTVFRVFDDKLPSRKSQNKYFC